MFKIIILLFITSGFLTCLPAPYEVYGMREGINNKKIEPEENKAEDLENSSVAVENEESAAIIIRELDKKVQKEIKNSNQNTELNSLKNKKGISIVSEIIPENFPKTEKNLGTAQNIQKGTAKQRWEQLSNISALHQERDKKISVNPKVFQVPLPKQTRGLYLTNATALDFKKIRVIVENCLKHDLNTLVIDVQGREIPTTTIDFIRSQNIFPVARVVVFDGGFKTAVPNPLHLQRIYSQIVKAAQLGFHEVQLDYIRYADSLAMQRLPLKQKYSEINKILTTAAEITRKMGIFLSADVFGRITLNQDDAIGQKLENFSQHMQTIYPMVYPSHYSFDTKRINDPYGTVKEGVEKSKKRLSNTRIVAYIQGFGMKVRQTGLSLPQYILAQIKAVDDAEGEGYIIWNPRNQYKDSYRAIADYNLQKDEKNRLAKN